MLDVAQNTARLNTLIAQYYTAETQLEDKTESKLSLTRSISQQTIDKNKDTLAMTNKYNELEDQLSASAKNVNVAGVTVPDLQNEAYTQNWFEQNWLKSNPEPVLGKGDFVKVDTSTQGFTVEELMNDPAVQSVATAQVDLTRPDDPGSDPGDPGQKPVKGEGESDESYDKKVAEWQQKKDAKDEYDKKKAAMDEWNQNYAAEVQKAAKQYVQSGYQTNKINDKNKEITEKFNKAHDEWTTEKQQATNMFIAAKAAAAGDTKALSRAKEKERQENEIAFQERQADLSAQESMLDQEIQMLQAEVTAIKTEIDSLKQERNSNVQSDFKLFG